MMRLGQLGADLRAGRLDVGAGGREMLDVVLYRESFVPLKRRLESLGLREYSRVIGADN